MERERGEEDEDRREWEVKIVASAFAREIFRLGIRKGGQAGTTSMDRGLAQSIRTFGDGSRQIRKVHKRHRSRTSWEVGGRGLSVVVVVIPRDYGLTASRTDTSDGRQHGTCLH